MARNCVVFVDLNGPLSALRQVLKCMGSDGVWYSQLVKGKDDLRLDAVMQQLFRVVNTFLALNRETRQRRLSIRTYKVRPSPSRPWHAPCVRCKCGHSVVSCFPLPSPLTDCVDRAVVGGSAVAGAPAQIVPLSPTAGVIEMVPALSLGDVLLGEDGVHARFAQSVSVCGARCSGVHSPDRTPAA